MLDVTTQRVLSQQHLHGTAVRTAQGFTGAKRGDPGPAGAEGLARFSAGLLGSPEAAYWPYLSVAVALAATGPQGPVYHRLEQKPRVGLPGLDAFRRWLGAREAPQGALRVPFDH